MLKILKMFFNIQQDQAKPKRSRFALLSVICLKKINSDFSFRTELRYLYMFAVLIFFCEDKESHKINPPFVCKHTAKLSLSSLATIFTFLKQLKPLKF